MKGKPASGSPSSSERENQPVDEDSQTACHCYGTALVVCSHCHLKLDEGMCTKCKRPLSSISNSSPTKPQNVQEKTTDSINLGSKEFETLTSMTKTPISRKKVASSKNIGKGSTIKDECSTGSSACSDDQTSLSEAETVDEDSQVEFDSDESVSTDFLDEYSCTSSSPKTESDIEDSLTESDSNGNGEQNEMTDASISGSPTFKVESSSPETLTADENSQTEFDPENGPEKWLEAWTRMISDCDKCMRKQPQDSEKESDVVNVPENSDLDKSVKELALDNHSEGLNMDNFQLGFELCNDAEEASVESESHNMPEANESSRINIQECGDYSTVLRCGECSCIKYHQTCKECFVCDRNCKFPINAKYCTCCEEMKNFYPEGMDEKKIFLPETKLDKKESNSETPVAAKYEKSPEVRNERTPRQQTVNDYSEILRCSKCNCIKNLGPCRDCLYFGGRCNFPPSAEFCTCCDIDKTLDLENYCAMKEISIIPNSGEIGINLNDKSSLCDECPDTSGGSGERVPVTEHFEIMQCGRCLCVRGWEHEPCALCPDSCSFPLNAEYCSCCVNL